MISRFLRRLKMAELGFDQSFVVKQGAKIVSTDCVTGKAVDPSAVQLVYYHGHCPDGFAAACVAWKARGERSEYVGLDHGGSWKPAEIIERAKGKHVVVVDFCFKKEVTDALIASCASFLVLDHHASAEIELAGVSERNKVFQMHQSGATLSWNFFFPERPVPLLLRYVEDRDIWRWALKDSEEVTTALQMTEQEFLTFDAILEGGESAIAELADKGKAITAYKRDVIRSHVKRAAACTIKAAPQFRAAVVNSSVLASEIGNALCQQPGVQCGVVWSWDHESHSCRVSLRSDSDEVDVSLIAKQFGGGGHKRAAGFNHLGPNIEELLIVDEMLRRIIGREKAPA
jgi:oligoribonuclease NrnB/cAMP/cGMP phosphodiesterase (DHH superfamily)